MATEQQLANLRPPIKPGEVRNPQGHNQYTYRRNFEKAVDQALGGKLSPELKQFIPESVLPLIEGREDLTTGEAIALVQIAKTLTGDEKATSETLARLWLKTERHEHTGPDGKDLAGQGESALDEFTRRMDVIESRREADTGADEPGSPGGLVQ